MIHPVLSTYKILKKKAFNENVDESWIDWAIEMIEAGFQSDNLYILAGTSKPYNQFELQQLADTVIKDLGLDYGSEDKVTRDYVYFIVTNSVHKPGTYLSTLRELKDICIGRDMDREYMDFYLLYFAKDDLAQSENQWYWEGATRENIDAIIKSQFIEWLTNYEHGQADSHVR